MSDATPKGPFAVESVPWTDFDKGKFGSRWRVLSDTRTEGSRLRIGVAVEELAPGKQSCTFHFHMLEEEHIWMLEGEATLRLGDDRIRFRAGEFVSFPAGEPAGHCLINESDAVCRYLVIGDNQPDEVCVYPDSNKIMVRAISRIPRDDIFDAGATRAYWDGEEGA